MGKYKQKHDDDLLKNNLLGMTSYKDLEEAEAFVFLLRAAQIEQKKYIISLFTVDSFKQLHHHLFKDLYPFAGQFRDVQLIKGNTRFCQAQYISAYSSELFYQLNKEPSWKSLQEAANRLAYFKSELNMLHPFREGNGRTIRIFIHHFAFSRGIKWEYEKMDREMYLRAMIHSVTNLEPLRQIFIDTISYRK
ncbi:Fic family protein [Lederbergia sp. NSJ-179]|uniref:Fic/DOC family protein n=1 Tax=Lederbergia sp. NSJ-179 TaxID=2931402 RepID=UPI001FD4D775|nr:Fic family protein [Lederbergia sp. NSJ-179]MCJ7842298.1 Fic family protein [Lederbergia sp. NSJ-179]